MLPFLARIQTRSANFAWPQVMYGAFPASIQNYWRIFFKNPGQSKYKIFQREQPHISILFKLEFVLQNEVV